MAIDHRKDSPQRGKPRIFGIAFMIQQAIANSPPGL